MFGGCFLSSEKDWIWVPNLAVKFSGCYLASLGNLKVSPRNLGSVAVVLDRLS